MTSLTLLIFFVVAVGVVAAGNSRNNVWDIVSFLSGNWTNRAQINAGSKEHDLFESRIIPVNIPALQNETILFLEDAVNGNVLALYLLGVTQDSTDENMVKMKHYDFNVTRKYKPGEFQVDELYNLTMADFHVDTNCIGSYVRLDEGVFSGLCIICNQVIDKQHPAFSVTLTCDAYTLTVPLSVTVRSTITPYVFQRKGQRFPSLNTPANYVNYCDKKFSGSTNSTQG